MNQYPPSDDCDDERLIEDVLRHAAPRLQPSVAVRQHAFDALHDEWLDMGGRRRRQRQFGLIGLAASLLVAVGIGAGWLRQPASPVSSPVASVLRTSGGDITVNGTLLDPDSALLTLATGDRLRTGNGARLAASWHTTGSMRLNEDSQLDVVAADTVRLLRGTLYYDSLQFGNEGAPSATIRVETPVGRISHHGTQFLASVDGDAVTVSVREGLVRIDGPAVDNIAVSAGHSMTVDADGRFREAKIEPYAEAWQWAADVAPAVQVDGRTVHDMLSWIGRETGLTVRYLSHKTRQNAAAEKLAGLGTLGPRQALRAIPVASLQLRYDIGDERIVVDTPE